MDGGLKVAWKQKELEEIGNSAINTAMQVTDRVWDPTLMNKGPGVPSAQLLVQKLTPSRAPATPANLERLTSSRFRLRCMHLGGGRHPQIQVWS